MYKVLIVEDERLESDALYRMIHNKRNRYHVCGRAYSGMQALELIHRYEPEIVLLDLMIPGINGLEVLRRVKLEDPYRKVIIITAYNEFDYAHQAIKSHVDDFLLKPIRPEELYRSLENVVLTLSTEEDLELIELEDMLIFHLVDQNYRPAIQYLWKFIDRLYTRHSKSINKLKERVEELQLRIYRTISDVLNERYPLGLCYKKLKAQTYRDKFDLYQEVSLVINKFFDQLLAKDTDNRRQFKNIQNFVDRHCKEDLSLESVGKFAKAPTQYISKIFKEETGKSFNSYVNDRKMDKAIELLIYTDNPITNISKDLSFKESNYFSKVFKKTTGVTPSEFRKSYLNE